jgi:hypothetical protein
VLTECDSVEVSYYISVCMYAFSMILPTTVDCYLAFKFWPDLRVQVKIVNILVNFLLYRQAPVMNYAFGYVDQPCMALC